MMKIELYLKYMNKLKTIGQSIDIYYNDLMPEFVVKIHGIGDPKHFRNTKLKKAIKQATEYLIAESEK